MASVGRSLSVALVLAFGFLGGLVVSGRLSLTPRSDASPQAPTAAPAGQTTPASRVPLTGGQLPDLSSIAEAALRVSVNITSTTIVRMPQDPIWQFFNGNQVQQSQSQSLGSGVIVSSDGYILTNTHVIGNAGARPSVRVTLRNSPQQPATLVGLDEVSDLAVIKVDARNLPTLPWGDSSKLRVAEWVLAVGNPFQLSGTVTLGIVSTVARSGDQVGAYEDFIQTDAAINPGNSGGALVNAKGELVGINTMIYSETGGYQGIGFAIPSNRARQIMDELIKHGSIAWGSVGRLDVVMVNQNAREYRVQATGAFVRSIGRTSPAYLAGIEPGDVIQRVNGQPISSGEQLDRLIISLPVGSTARFEVVKENGRAVRVDVPVGDRREQPTRRLR
jgi:S1-C subfamily serine protease